MYTYQDPGITTPLSQYPVLPFYNHDFPNIPQTCLSNLMNDDFNDFNYDDGNNHGVSGHREMTDYL